MLLIDRLGVDYARAGGGRTLRLRTVEYMRWAKALAMEEGIHKLAQSGIYDLLSAEDLGLDKLELHIHDKHTDGLPKLKEAIGSRYRVDANSVLTAEGSSLANFLILASWVRPGDPVLLEDPCYEPLEAVLGALGARVMRVPIDGKEESCP